MDFEDSQQLFLVPCKDFFSPLLGCFSSFRGLPTSTHGLWAFLWKWPQAKSSPMDYVGQEESAACDHCGPQLSLQ